MRNIQRCGRDGHGVFLPIHHIAAGCADLLIAVLALRKILEHRLAVRACGNIRHLFASTVVQAVGHTRQRLTGIGVHLIDSQAAFRQCICPFLRNIQRCGRDGHGIFLPIHHIAAGCADLLVTVLALRQILEHRLAIRTGSNIRHLFPCTVVQSVCHTRQRLAGIGIDLIDGQAAFLLHGHDLNVSLHGIAPHAGVTGQRLIPSKPVIPADYRSVRIDLIRAAGGRVGLFRGQSLGRRSCGRDGQFVAPLCKGDAASVICAEIVIAQHLVIVRDRGCVAARCVLLQFDGIAPARRKR